METLLAKPSKEIVDKALRCKEYFGDKGGITLSGGEPLLQAEKPIHSKAFLED